MAKHSYQLFNNEAFEEWAYREGLYPAESRFIEQNLCWIPKDARILDIGTGGGRIAFGMRQYGFSRFIGIDMSERLIDVARSRCKELGLGKEMEFSIDNACALSFSDSSMDAVVAFQQLFSLIEDEKERGNALREAYRVLAPGGVLLFNVLSWEARWFNPLLSMALKPLKVLRRERNSRGRRYLCWLRVGRRRDLRLLLNRESYTYTYWFLKSEIVALLEKIGFNVLNVASSKMLIENQHSFKFGGTLFISARKPLACERGGEP